MRTLGWLGLALADLTHPPLVEPRSQYCCTSLHLPTSQAMSIIRVTETIDHSSQSILIKWSSSEPHQFVDSSPLLRSCNPALSRAVLLNVDAQAPRRRIHIHLEAHLELCKFEL
jgi:hypothetical protein